MDLLAALAAAISLAVPGRTSANPSVSADGQFVAVAWSASEAAGATDIYAAVSRDGARTFDPPVRVNSAAGEARANGEQPPRVVLVHQNGAPPVMTIVWTAKGTAGTKLVSARSDDGGRTFRSSETLPDTDAPGNRGWHNTAVDPAGRIYAVWLDHRALARDESMPAAHHEHAAAGRPDGVAMAQKSSLYIQSLDGAVAPHVITNGVCYCCKTGLTIDHHGVVHAVWRHVYPGNMRDIAYARSSDGGRTFTAPARISEDRWMLDGCPDDGPAIAADAADRIHVVWPTLVADEREGDATIALFYASSLRGGAFTPRLRLPTEGIAHHPQIAVARDGSLVAAWDETANGARRVVTARAAPSAGAGRRFVRRIVSSDAAAVYPALATIDNGTVAVWTTKTPAGSAISVARLEF